MRAHLQTALANEELVKEARELTDDISKEMITKWANRVAFFEAKDMAKTVRAYLTNCASKSLKVTSESLTEALRGHEYLAKLLLEPIKVAKVKTPTQLMGLKAIQKILVGE
jgi:hypothetical protein